jgi:hypothetical protein
MENEKNNSQSEQYKQYEEVIIKQEDRYSLVLDILQRAFDKKTLVVDDNANSDKQTRLFEKRKEIAGRIADGIQVEIDGAGALLHELVEIHKEGKENDLHGKRRDSSVVMLGARADARNDIKALKEAHKSLLLGKMSSPRSEEKESGRGGRG